jgi:pyruvate kinase
MIWSIGDNLIEPFALKKNPQGAAMKNKQTKIICTISNKHCEPEFISELAEAGMNLARLNTAHMQPADAQCVVDNIRSISQQIGILIDTKGPEVRIAELPSHWIDRQAMKFVWHRIICRKTDSG